MADKEKLTPIEQCQKWWEATDDFWTSRHDSMDRLEEFLSGDRYDQDSGRFNKTKNLIQIRGQEIQDTIRHIAAKATERPRNIEARALDKIDDPDDSEIAVALLEHETGNPWKDFDGMLEAAIIDCREKRLGVVWFDWEPECGQFGEILFCNPDPRSVRWDPAYEDPHHPLCDVVVVTKRVNAEAANRAYGVKWIKPDPNTMRNETRERTGEPVQSGNHGRETNRYDDQKATLRFFWWKNDPSKKYSPDEPETERELKPEDRYMACASGCGYRSEPQGDGMELPEMAGMEMPYPVTPEEMNGGEPLEWAEGCPMCAGDVKRVDVKEIDETTAAQEKGKRLIIMAPYSQAPDENVPVYDGKWPIPSARSFPGIFVTAYQKPREPTGPCDVDHMWDQQVASDQMRTVMIRRVFRHTNYWEVPLDGVYDADRERFDFTSDSFDMDFNVMFRDGTNQFQSPVTLHKGIGIDPNFFPALQVVDSALTRYRPQLDIGAAGEDTRNIPVGTIERITHEAEVSTEHFKRRVARAVGKGYGVLWDMIRYTYTPARLSRLNIDGVDIMANLQGDDLPNWDFIISESPQFTGLDKTKAEAWPAMMGVYAQSVQMQLDPIAAIEMWGELTNIPRSIVRKFTKMLERMRAEAEQAQMEAEAVAGGLPGEVAGGLPGGPPPEEMDPLAEMAGLEQAPIPGYARGAVSQPGGPAIVGENGPELVHLAPNTPVIPRNQVQRMADFLGTFGGLLPKVTFQQAGAAAASLAPNFQPMPKNATPKQILDWATSVPGVLPVGGMRPATLTKGLSGEPGFVYHATNEERLREIAESGKLKPHRPWFGTDQPNWPDMSTERRIYFGQSPERLYQFAPEEGRAVVLRTKHGKNIFREGTGDLFARKPIEAKGLEYLGDDKKWHPLESLLKDQ